MPENYHLTFSKTESNDADVARVLEAGGNVAAVFSRDAFKASVASGVAHGFKLAPWEGAPVIDGDAHDYRPAEGMQGAIIALKAKGDARNDTTGFVIR